MSTVEENTCVQLDLIAVDHGRKNHYAITPILVKVGMNLLL